MKIILKQIRDEMRVVRQRMSPGDLCDYYWGRFSGLSLSARLLTDRFCVGDPIRCPDCGAPMRADGSCCDECKWVLASDGQRRPT